MEEGDDMQLTNCPPPHPHPRRTPTKGFIFKFHYNGNSLRFEPVDPSVLGGFIFLLK